MSDSLIELKRQLESLQSALLNANVNAVDNTGELEGCIINVQQALKVIKDPPNTHLIYKLERILQLIVDDLKKPSIRELSDIKSKGYEKLKKFIKPSTTMSQLTFSSDRRTSIVKQPTARVKHHK